MTINVLLSYAFHAKTDLADVRKRLSCGSIMIDSGAYTAHTQGKAINVTEYGAYLTAWQGQWDHAVTLDSIGDPTTSRRNTARLHSHGLRVMPVFTRGDSVTEFDAMVRDCGYVCVGGGIGMSTTTMLARITALQRRAADLGGGIHALGMGGIPMLRKARPFSGDSSNASGIFQYGKVCVFDGHRVRSIAVSNKPKIRRYWKVLREHGVDVAALAGEGRIPQGTGGELMQACNHLADTCADEWLRATTPSVPPPLPGLAAGPHMYGALVNRTVLDTALALNTALHRGYNPPVWQIHGRRHHCLDMHAGAA